jgi:hypothetical protein
MSSNPPISFAAKAKTASNTATGGYPYSLSGTDLDQNFVFATAQFAEDEFKITTTSGTGGHEAREIKITYPVPTPPTTGTHVLGVKDGTLQWIATEEC